MKVGINLKIVDFELDPDKLYIFLRLIEICFNIFCLVSSF